MHSYRGIKFTASQTTSKLTAGKVCYQGQVIHNQTLNEAETRNAFAPYLPRPLCGLGSDPTAKLGPTQPRSWVGPNPAGGSNPTPSVGRTQNRAWVRPKTAGG